MLEKKEQLNFDAINKHAKAIADFIEAKKSKIINTLLCYETYQVAIDEIGRTLDLLRSLFENSEYFKEKIERVATFLPSNQPLYAFFCFAVIPSFMSKEVYVKAPEVMGRFFFDLMDVLELRHNFPNIHVSAKKRSDFLIEVTATRLDKVTNTIYPITDAVIFTGTMKNADKIRKLFNPSVLFIANGSGHNPVVVTETANIDRAVESILRVQLYNSGQDCAAPNSILVHKDQIDFFLVKLRKAVSKVKVGHYNDIDVIVGPINREENLQKITKFLLDNSKWLDTTTDGTIHTKTRIVEPTIIVKPLKEGGNYIESFTPIFFVQLYGHDKELNLYFENPRYRKNAMYVTVFGRSPYIESLISSVDYIFHDESTIIRNTDLHTPGVERGTQPYGGYSKGASYVSISGKRIAKPTLPQRDIYEYLVHQKVIYRKKKKEGDSMSIDSKQIPGKHWSELFADSVLESFPDRKVYTCAAGITPSGIVHFGNLRDVITSMAVSQEIQKRGKKTRFIFSWDDFDRFRKVPSGIKESHEQYIGLPLTSVPCPDGNFSSYAEKFEKEFEEAMRELGIDLEYRYQTKEYTSGKYDDLIIHSLQNRIKIADILLSFMSENSIINKNINPKEYREDYYPILVYSRFSGKDNTRVLNYDGDTKITCKCFDTGKTETVDITKERIVKLSWKVDWAMRWKHEGVVFEPGGHDHASPGGSYDTATVIAKEVFGIKSPVFKEYKFVGIQGLGEKMSSSRGNAVSPKKLLEIYSPELLKWLYFRKRPNQTFSLAFDSEIYRQYSEFDQEVMQLANKSSGVEKISLQLSGINQNNTAVKKLIPFRQAVAFGQIVQWNKEKMMIILRELELDYDLKSVDTRLVKARAWLETYNQEESIRLRDKVNSEYVNKLDKKNIEHVRALRKELTSHDDMSIRELEKLLYSIPKNPSLSAKENSPLQRSFFKVVYNLLIDRDTGPRLSTFLWIIGKERISPLLDI